MSLALLPAGAEIWLGVAGGYLSGSVPVGYLWARLGYGVDIRRLGSGNIGATNVARVLASPAAGICVFALDVAKGWAPVAAWQAWGSGGVAGGHGALWAYAVALAAVVGHCCPVWLSFRGGKGVATGLGVVSALFPLAALLSLLTWCLSAALTRFVSLSSILAAALFPVWLAIGYGPHPAGSPEGRWALGFSVLCAAAVVIRHKENMKRLAAGTEPKIGRKEKG